MRPGRGRDVVGGDLHWAWFRCCHLPARRQQTSPGPLAGQPGVLTGRRRACTTPGDASSRARGAACELTGIKGRRRLEAETRKKVPRLAIDRIRECPFHQAIFPVRRSSAGCPRPGGASDRSRSYVSLATGAIPKRKKATTPGARGPPGAPSSVVPPYPRIHPTVQGTSKGHRQSSAARNGATPC